MSAFVPDSRSTEEIERERRERFDHELIAFIDKRLDQFREVNPRALLLILCSLQSPKQTTPNVVVSAFPYLRKWPRTKRGRLWWKLVVDDSEAFHLFDSMKTCKWWLDEAARNRRIRPTSSVFRHITDKMRWLLSPAGLDAIRAEVDALPRIHIEKSNRGRRPPSRRSQLLALGIPA